MLALDRPLGVVADLVLFGDHADPLLVHYTPTRPRLALTAQGEPEIAFVKFRAADAAAGGVGLLSFTTELAASEAQLEAARRQLERDGRPEAQLAPIAWTGGTAVFAAALREGDGFVEQLIGEVTPDLVGSQRALFSLRLDEDGARLVEALARAEGPSPLGVRYELRYAGLRPALAVTIEADYRRVYDEFSMGFEFGVAYQGVGVRAAVEIATQKLIQSGALRIEVQQFSDAAELRARVDEAVRWLQERLLEDFFKTSLQPPQREGDLLARAIEAAARLGAASLKDALADVSMADRLARDLGVPVGALSSLAGLGGGGPGAGAGGAVPGAGGAAGAGTGGGAAGASTGGGAAGAAGSSTSTFALKLQFSLRDIHQEELKTLRFDWTEARAETRTAAPQGLLDGLGPRLRVVEASDAGAYWEKLDINVHALGDFAALGVERLVVQLAFPDEQQPSAQQALRFERADAATPQRFAAWTDGRAPVYRLRHEVHFTDGGAWPGPPVYAGAWRSERSLEPGLHPLAEVPRLEIEVAPGGLSFDETPQVSVDLRVDGEPAQTLLLSAQAPKQVFRRRLAAAAATAGRADGAGAGAAGAGTGVDPAAVAPPGGSGSGPATAASPRRPLVEARCTWFLAEGPRLAGDWQAVEGTALLVPGPWRSTRTLRLVPLLPVDALEALVTLRVEDGARSHSEELRFEPGDRRARSVAIRCLSEPAPPVIADWLVVRADGSTFVAEPVETTEPVLVVRDRDGSQRQVTVRLLAGPDLHAHGLIAVQVELLDGRDDTVLDQLVFTGSQRGPGQLLVPLDDGALPARVRVTRYALDGASAVAAPVVMTGSEWLVPAVAQIA